MISGWSSQGMWGARDMQHTEEDEKHMQNIGRKTRDLDVGGMVMLKRILETHEGVNWIQVA
jgi:hypothetical protein